MKKYDFSTEKVKEYYHGNFSRDLQCYFKLVPSSRGIAMIRHLDNHFNNRSYYLLSFLYPHTYHTGLRASGNPAQATYLNFIFAGIFYFMMLIPQVIKELYGKETEYNFYKASGWPLVSAGMAGQIAPDLMLKEAILYPNSAEKDNFINMLSGVSPLMLEEIKEFLSLEEVENLDNEAHKNLLKSIKPSLNELMTRLTVRSMEFSVKLRIEANNSSEP